MSFESDLIELLDSLKTNNFDKNPEVEIFNLICYSLRQHSPKIYKSTKKKITGNFENGLHIIHEPNGSQQAPDIRIINDGKILNIECKSSKRKNSPVWNSGIVEDDTIYILAKTGEKRNLTYFLGRDTNWKKFHELFVDCENQIGDVVVKFNKTIKDLGLNMSYYKRNMFNDNENYFKMSNKNEESVKNYINTFWSE